MDGERSLFTLAIHLIIEVSPSVDIDVAAETALTTPYCRIDDEFAIIKIQCKEVFTLRDTECLRVVIGERNLRTQQVAGHPEVALADSSEAIRNDVIPVITKLGGEAEIVVAVVASVGGYSGGVKTPIIIVIHLHTLTRIPIVAINLSEDEYIW